MKNLKFRAWSKNIKKMYQWSDIKRFGNLNKLISLSDVDVMQWTGLTDKYGKDIYEGDYIVDRYPIDDEDLTLGYNESLLPVMWSEKLLTWCVDTSFVKDGSYLVPIKVYFGEFLEVKGNIYEN